MPSIQWVFYTRIICNVQSVKEAWFLCQMGVSQTYKYEVGT